MSRLQKLDKSKKNSWIKDAEYRIKNKKWLQYSSNIARRIIAAMKENNIQQNELAETIKVRPQYISRVVKGHENLSLSTIAKLSEALSVDLIIFPSYAYSNSTNLIKESAEVNGNRHKRPIENILSIDTGYVSISTQALKEIESILEREQSTNQPKIELQETGFSLISQR
jgi:transcriptional regulator with XRE-family HTH domain